MILPSTIRKSLEIQGFVCSNEPEFMAIVPWLRFTYGLCAVLTALATWLASVPFLWILAALSLVGAFSPVHPFDLVYNHFIRPYTKTQPLPPNGMPKRFACGMGAVWIAVVALLFQSGEPGWAQLLGGLFAAAAGLAAVTHLCIPSTIFGLLFKDRK